VLGPIFGQVHYRRELRAKVLDGLATVERERWASSEDRSAFRAAIVQLRGAGLVLRVAALTPQRMEEWRRELLAAGTTPYMFNRALELAGQLLAAAKRRGFVAVNGARDLERLEHKTATGLVASPEQVEA